uniref:CSON015065 protein n=1 Tax=Culicoides sonorensis TaxID=179676 RepID=A0A336KU47_CULSO
MFTMPLHHPKFLVTSYSDASTLETRKNHFCIQRLVLEGVLLLLCQLNAFFWLMHLWFSLFEQAPLVSL